MRFPIIKLLDYNDKWAELEADPNPFAVVVMAHLKNQQIKNADELMGWKLRLVRLLYERGYDRQDIIELFRFIDWLIKLPDDLEKKFWAEVVRQEEELRMPYVTIGERIGIEKGLQQGREEGRQAEALAVILRQLKRRFGELDPAVEKRVTALSLIQLEELSEDLLDFTDVNGLTNWIRTTKES
jgi:hypothetical protein